MRLAHICGECYQPLFALNVSSGGIRSHTRHIQDHWNTCDAMVARGLRYSDKNPARAAELEARVKARQGK